MDRDSLFDVPRGEWEHVILTEDGELIPMRFETPNDDDIRWALRCLQRQEVL